MKKKKRPGRRIVSIYGLVILAIAVIWALMLSDGGLGILAHRGIRGEKFQTVTALCTRVDVIDRFDMVRNSTQKSYTFQLKNEGSYRINATASMLHEIGISEETLRAMEGKVLTIEYVNSPFSAYPLISLCSENEIVIPGELSIQQWEATWSSTHLCLAFFGGLGILGILCDSLPPLIRTEKKKRRLRRKKLRRQQLLEQKAQKSKTKNHW